MTAHTTRASRAVIYQAPNPSVVYDDILLQKFLNYFSQNAASQVWSFKLPQLVSAKNAAAMKTAARAVSLAFAAKHTGNPSMAAAACEYYGHSLRHHQASFVAPTGRSICRKKAVNALPVTVLLSYFEMIQPTGLEAWSEHTAAAEQLFVLLGRDALKDSLLNHLYFIVRSSSAIRCFLYGSRTLLLEQSWSEVPMATACGKGAAIFNHLVDLILWLSDCLAAGNDESNGTSRSMYDTSTLHNTLHDLVRLWDSLGQAIQLDTTTSPLLSPKVATPSLLHSSTIASEPSIPDLPPALHDPSAALTASFHHAATILTLILLQHQPKTSAHTYYQNQFNTTPSSGSSPSSITHHSTQILALALYLESQGIGCSCLRMMLPLAVVHRFCPDPAYQLLAEVVFRRWSTNDGLVGLGVVAFGRRRGVGRRCLKESS